MGKMRMRRGGSARGHNGLKSVTAAMMPGTEYTKIGVGIGRLESRESRDVAAYVMRKMTRVELRSMQDVAGPIAAAIREMRRGMG